MNRELAAVLQALAEVMTPRVGAIHQNRMLAIIIFLHTCLLDTSKSLYMAESHLSANQHYINHYIKQVECYTWSANHSTEPL